MRLVFFFLVFTFDYIFLYGVPMYLLVLPFLSGGIKSVIIQYSYDRSIKPIVNTVFIYSAILLAINFLHGNLNAGFFQVFVLNVLVLIIGIELYKFAKQDVKLKGHNYLLIVFGLNALVALLQSMKVAGFWEIPEQINSMFNGQVENKYFGLDFEFLNRVRGLFLYVHKFSPAIMVASVFFIFKTYISKKKIIYFCAALFMLYVALLTQTRSILIGLLLGIVISLLFYFKSIKLKIVIMVSLGIGLIYSLNSDLGTYIFERSNISSSKTLAYTDIYRMKGINFSIQKFIDNPFIGSSEKLYIDNFESLTVHGVFFRILGDYGALGFISYVGMMLSVITNIYKSTTNIFKSLFTVVLLIFIVDLLTHSSGFLFYDIFQFPFLMLLFGYSKNKKLQGI